MRKQRALQPCTALLRDGSRCGKYAKADDVFCAVHQPGYKPTGAAVARPKPVSHEERLRRFAESSDPRVAMQAIGILERRRDASEGRPTLDPRAFIDALTPDERDHLRDLIAQLRELQRAVYDRVPKLRPPTFPTEDDVVDPADVVSAADPIPASAEPSTEDAPAPPQEEDPYADYEVVE
jgi:hypothetical protein